MIELLIAFTVGVAAGMAIEAGVRRVEWRSVLRRRAKAGPRHKNEWSLPRNSQFTSFETTPKLHLVGIDDYIAELRKNAELRAEGTDD